MNYSRAPLTNTKTHQLEQKLKTSLGVLIYRSQQSEAANSFNEPAAVVTLVRKLCEAYRVLSSPCFWMESNVIMRKMALWIKEKQ